MDTIIEEPIKDDIFPDKDDINPAGFQAVEQTFGAERPRYFIMCVGGGAPTRQHFSRYRAEGEARRLAARFPDRLFHVVKVKSSFIAPINKIAMEEARSKLALGMTVRVGPFHHRNAGETGEITAFKENGAVEVRLESQAMYDFAPTSLYPAGRDEQQVGAIAREGMGG